MTPPIASANVSPAPQVARPQRPRITSDQLFSATNEIVIEHRGEEYRLRLTRNDKLILNK